MPARLGPAAARQRSRVGALDAALYAGSALVERRYQPGVLDVVPGAAGAYAPVRIRHLYEGPTVRVRRLSDNVERDATHEEVVGLALLAWAAGADMAVVRLYNQALGGTVHAEQLTAALQPRLVGAGTAGAVTRSDGTQYLAASLPAVAQRTLYGAARYTSLPAGTTRVLGADAFACWQANSSLPPWRWRGSSVMTVGGTCTLPTRIAARYDGAETRVRVAQAGYDSGLVLAVSGTGLLASGGLGIHAASTVGNSPAASDVRAVVSYPTSHADATVAAALAALAVLYP